MADKVPTPASAETGFIFTMSQPENPFIADTYFQRILATYLPQDMLAEVAPALTKFGEDTISPQVKEWNLNAERQQPFVEKHNVWGARHPVDRLVTSEGWKALRKWGAEEGTVAIGYETQYGAYNRIVQHAKNYLFSPVSGLTGCPLSMTDGTARLLRSQLPNLPASHPFHEVYRRLTARTSAWTSGQWMTERPGGSDVHNTETWARYAPLSDKHGGNGLDEGDYLVSGFKFFSSATDADVTMLLAKTESGRLSAFLAPLTKTVVAADGSRSVATNGVRIHRLKNKFGTKQLPTAELELQDVRAHLVGPVDRGVATISHLLNVTRAWAFLSSVAAMRRGLAIAKHFALHRTVFGYPLWALPLHLRTLGDMEVRVRGFAQLAFFTISLMSFTESERFPESLPAVVPLPKDGEQAMVVLRALTAAAKAVTSKNAVVTMQECMEALGGVGYMDDPDEPENVARALRDISVNAIWEGTTNVLSSEFVRHVLNRDHLEHIHAWLSRAIAGIRNNEYRDALQTSWDNLHGRLQGNKDYIFDVLSVGRGVMFSFSWIVVGVLLAWDAQRDGDELANEVARRSILNGEGGLREWLLPDVGAPAATARFDESKERAKWDCRLVWDKELPDFAPFGQRIPLGSKM